MPNFIQQNGSIAMVLGGKPVSVAKTDSKYPEVVKAIQDKLPDEEILAIIEREKRRLEEATEVLPGIELVGGLLKYEGEPIAGVLGERMLQMLDEGFDLRHMATFLQNLLENPSRRVVEHLYAFLEAGNIPLTDDGHFLAYKAVREDWKDIHSGKFDNSIGKELSMPRHRVDEDPDRTCSHGFHVCSFAYLPYFSHASGHVVVCKVNPRDVVAIPRDYGNTKMRVCRYTVVSEYEGYYAEKGDTLGGSAMRSADASMPFVLEADYSGDGEFEEVEAFDNLVKAAEAMRDFEENTMSDFVATVRIRNIVSGTILDSRAVENDNSDEPTGDSDSYEVYGIRENGERVLVADGFETEGDAVLYAISVDKAEHAEVYTGFEIEDLDSNVVRTLS